MPVNIYNNVFINSCNPILIEGSNHVNITNNRIYNTTYLTGCIAGIIITQITKNLSGNIEISGNNINLTDTGIAVQNSQNVSITNNNIDNTTTYTDAWGTAIRVEYNVSNVTISLNTIRNSAGAGIMIRQTENITINNNSIDQLPIMSRNILGKQGPEPAYMSGIALIELYLGYTGESNELVTDTITKISRYNNTNIRIFNNTFGSNIQIPLVSQGTTNLSHDITNYWYININFNRDLMNSYKYFISRNYDKLQCEYSNYAGRPGQTIMDYCSFQYPWGFNYTNLLNNYAIFYITKNQWNVTNYNTTIYNMTFSNLTFPLNDVRRNGTLINTSAINVTYAVNTGENVSVGFFNTTKAINQTINITITIPTTEQSVIGVGFDAARVTT
jgi:hypothetical protein